jgi:RsiW-degrading membrane proteinase PrsW (M82 family)
MFKKLFTFSRNDLALLWLLLPVVVVVVINHSLPHALPNDPLDKVKIYQENIIPEKAVPILLHLLDEKPFDMDLNYRYIQNHFDIFKGSGESGRDDKTIHDRYEKYTQQPETADLGYYGLGYMESRRKHYSSALTNFMQVKNRELKYLNNSIGYVYKSLGDLDQAEEFFRREINLGGNIQGAVGNLAALYKKQGEFTKLRLLVDDKQTKAYVTPDEKGYLALRSGQILHYLEYLYINPFGYINGYAALCALLICGIWFIYLWRIDLFTQEPLSLAVTTLLSGAFMALTCSFLYDLWFMINPIDMGESLAHDFIFFIFHVGIIEEAVKFIPVVIIVLLLGERINDPLDLLLLGGLSALGFATLENSLYFSVFGLRIAFGRFILSTVLHMSFTILVCYIWAKARFIKPRNEFFSVLIGFTFAACLHGLFDFVGGSDNAYTLLFPVIIGLTAYIFARILNTCLMNSARSSFILTSLNSQQMNNNHLLFATASVLLIISYLYDNFHYATEIANRDFIIMSFVTIFSLGAVFYPLVNIGLPNGLIVLRLRKKITFIPVKPLHRSFKKVYRS